MSGSDNAVLVSDHEIAFQLLEMVASVQWLAWLAWLVVVAADGDWAVDEDVVAEEDCAADENWAAGTTCGTAVLGSGQCQRSVRISSGGGEICRDIVSA